MLFVLIIVLYFFILVFSFYMREKMCIRDRAYRMEKIQLMLLSLRTLEIKSDVRRLFVHDNRMFAERAFYCPEQKFFEDIINMTYSCRVESGIISVSYTHLMEWWICSVWL